jgi:hypothetical protein
MFESLDQVDWHALNDAYGPSLSTPDRIRNLASPSQAKREKALTELSGTIYHQGTIYAASVAAVPFLLEIVGSPEVADRTPTLEILQALSTGTSFHEVHASLIFYREKSKEPEWQEQVREEKAWVAAIHERLSAAVPVITEVLAHGREPERVAAASLLATLADNAGAVEALMAAATDPNPSLSAAAITALGAQENAPEELLERIFERASNELVRTVAALNILFHRERNAPPAAVEHLLRHLRAPEPELRKAYEALPDVGAFLGDVGKALAAGPPAAAQEAFPLLYQQVKASPYSLNSSENFGLLILAVMLAPPPNRTWVPSAMTLPQRQAIRLVADRAWRIERGIPTTSCNLVDLFESVGLPGKREALFALLAGTPEGAQTEREQRKWSASRKRPWWKWF